MYHREVPQSRTAFVNYHQNMKGIHPLSSVRPGVAGRAEGCCVQYCHTGSSWSIPSRVQSSPKLVMNLRHHQVWSCSCSRCSTTSYPRFPHHFHLRQGCTSTRKSPRMTVITANRSDESRRLISEPVCFIVSAIASISLQSKFRPSTAQAMAVFPHAGCWRAVASMHRLPATSRGG